MFQINVGIIDLSTFSKYEIIGEDCKSFLDRLCSNTIPKKDGSIVLTHTHNNIGRIQSELTITKVKNNHYYVLSAALSEIRDLDWFNQNKLKNEKVDINNVTSDYGALGLIGPKSRAVLKKVTKENIENEIFPLVEGKRN